MDVKLVAIGGKKAGMVIPILASRFLIGRGHRCHIRPQGDLIGDLHCAISTDGDSATLEDGGTPAGTFVNGERVVGRRPLHNGDRIKIGPLEFEVRLASQNAGKTKPSIHESNVVAGRKLEKTATSEKNSEMEPTDLLLLATIIPLVGFLLSFLPTFWFWRAVGGIFLAVFAWTLVARARRMNGFLWDALNVAVVFLAAMVVYLMLPQDWLWQGGSAALMVALAVVVAVRIWRNRLDETNLALLAAIGILAFILITVLSPGPWAWFADLMVLVCLFGLSMIRARKTIESKEKSHAESATRFDELTLLLLTPILVLTVFAVGQSVSMFNPWQGGAVLLWTLLTSVFGIRVIGRSVRTWNEADWVLAAVVGFLTPMVASLVVPVFWVWVVEASVLLAAVAAFFYFDGKRVLKRRSDQLLLQWTVVGIALVAIFGFVFQITW